MEPDYILATSAREIVESSLRKGGHSFTLHHRGISVSYEEEAKAAQIIIWRLGSLDLEVSHNRAGFVILVVCKGCLSLTGYPGLQHLTEDFGALNSMAYYLGGDSFAGTR